MTTRHAAMLAGLVFASVLHAQTPPARPGWLGFLASELKPAEVKKRHVYPYNRPTIGALLPGDVAEKAGLKVGDVLLELNDHDVLSHEKLLDLLNQTPPG